ncbi:MAG: hypothetical protein O7D94_10215 [Planctomycetota bacterium]|nr:hypothetical protein [Planctomycetota bacterium]
MARTGQIASAIMVAHLAWSSPIAAQVDNRIDRSSPSAATRLHDANPGVGSGGYNQGRPAFSAGFRANAIVTGNVTGLERFHGFSPVLQHNSFRAAMPSSSLYDFNARGVGVEDVMAGRTQSPTYFFNPARTISDLGAIRRGLNSPGSSALASPYVRPQWLAAQTGFWTYEPFVPNLQDRRVSQEPMVNQAVVHRPIDLGATTAAPEASFATPWYDRASTSSIFGPRLPEAADRRSGLMAAALEHVGAVGANPAFDAEEDPWPAEPFAAPVGVSGVESGASVGAAAVEAGGIEYDVSEPTAPLRISVADTRRLATAETWGGRSIQDPVEAYARKHRETVNLLLAEGRAAMRRGEYYRAAGKFRIAHEIDPRNALPLLQRGHALAAAGAYVTSVRMLIRGIERHPDFADFDVDLPAMIDDRDDFDRRRAEIDSHLQRSEDYELRFLLGYLEYYSSLKEEGLQDLKAAAAGAPAAGPIAAFPGLVSKGDREPADSPN